MIVAECYANACFAEELKKLLDKEGVQHIEIKHKSTMGRDRILRDLIRIAKMTSNLVVAVIDYEKGVARVYVEKQFRALKINGDVLLGISKQRENLIAIIFDPNIEEGLLCRVDQTLCRDIHYYREIKSNRACNVLEKYLKEVPIQKILYTIVNKLISLVSENQSNTP